jgi:hypothetical protein
MENMSAEKIKRDGDINHIKNFFEDICDVADTLLKRGNPCKPELKEDKVTCMNPSQDFCCTNCEHLSKSGCLVRAPSCKLWLCRESHRDNPILSRILYGIRNQIMGKIIEGYSLITYRLSIEEIMKQIEELDDDVTLKISCRILDVSSHFNLIKDLIKFYEGE